ncbi:hypothetical protein BJ878DRAFT_506841 [Calycina marina]|uniref:ARID domain-containing protein n=1 Tax=Calycina marina TaxID=1763456 RepID=A0A9P7Z2Q2_9HELO|nr:hypothetical protein BJ878DRAFT_506841 [Calycina marina]
MNSWMNEPAAVQQNHNGAGTGFNHDSNMLLANNPNASFDPSQFQNSQLQRMQNGGMRNGSPAFQTNSMIPSKRPREANLGTSPRHAPTMLPNSRSQTPSQTPYPGYQPNSTPSQHPPQQTPYTHLRNGSTNNSPSPIMGNPLARPGGVPQRVSTASPHPFSPAVQQQFAPQHSPSQSDHGSRVDTPQNSAFSHNPGFQQGFNANFPPNSGRSSAPPQSSIMPQAQPMQQNPMYAQQQHQQQQAQQQARAANDKMMYQMKLQQQLQQQQQSMMGQRQGIPQNTNPLAKVQAQGPNGQFAGMQALPGSRGPNTDQFMKSLRAFMQSKQLPLEETPVIEGQPIPIMTLYLTLAKFGGGRKVSQNPNGWAMVAQSLHFQAPQVPGASLALRTVYEKYLMMFEEAWQQNQIRQRQALQQHQQQAAISRGMVAGGQMSPTKQMMPLMMQQSQQSQKSQQSQQSQQLMQQQFMQQQQIMAQQLSQQSAAKPVVSMQQPAINGFSSQSPQIQSQHQTLPRNSLSRSIDQGVPPQSAGSYAMPSPVSGVTPGPQSVAPPPVEASAVYEVPINRELPDDLDPKVRHLDTHGGVQVDSLAKLGTQLALYRPDVPHVQDLGTIDIHALTMSLQSGIKAEVRLALDTLLVISVESRIPLELHQCEDLVDAMVDCAEEQVNALAENAAEVSDVMLITSYEDVSRACRTEHETLQDIPRFGSPEYELDRAVERLICITTIMRNLSFLEKNQPHLADESVIKFLCVVIRYLGTRNMLLRSHKNGLDFMKDVIIILSNLAHIIELPDREQAICLLHFLLAFAPCPSPNAGPEVTFSTYDPAIHRYLPPALDSLAKLLARDEPNRTFYKRIFSNDVSSTPPYDLLTRAFALAVSPIPVEKQEAKRGFVVLLVEARKPILMQGMLIAEILSNLAPGYESGLAMSWLKSDDGFAQNLCRMVMSLLTDTTVSNSQNQRTASRMEDEPLLRITTAGIGVLHTLTEKCRNPDDPASAVPLVGMPSETRLLSALEIGSARSNQDVGNPRAHYLNGVLKQLCAYVGLASLDI